MAMKHHRLGQTDRRTDGRLTVAIPRDGKNCIDFKNCADFLRVNILRIVYWLYSPSSGFSVINNLLQLTRSKQWQQRSPQQQQSYVWYLTVLLNYLVHKGTLWVPTEQYWNITNSSNYCYTTITNEISQKYLSIQHNGSSTSVRQQQINERQTGFVSGIVAGNETSASARTDWIMPGFHHSVAVLPLPFRRSRQPPPFPYTVAVAAAYLYRNGTEFSYVIFFYKTTELYNGTTAKRQRKNGNGMVETGHEGSTPNIC